MGKHDDFTRIFDRLDRFEGRSAGRVLTDRARLWILRLLVDLDGHQEFVRERGFCGKSLARVLGLTEWVDLKDREFDAGNVRQQLRYMLLEAEGKGSRREENPYLDRNLARFRSLLGLTDADIALLEFAVYVHADSTVNRVTEFLGNLSSARLLDALRDILKLPDQEVRLALDPGGLLARTGLLTVDHSYQGALDGKLDLVSSGFASKISSMDADPLSLLEGMVNRTSRPDLDLHDYPHMQPQLDLLLPYLVRVQETARRGVNILIHGAPGTGKTQFVKAVAGELGLELFEVASEDEKGEPFAAQARLRASRAAQSILSRQGTLLLFDEVEDVFSDGDTFLGHKSTAQVRKAWINKALEENPVPCVWLSNSIGGMDRAFIRRFDMSFEIPVPPKKVREKIVRKACPDLLSDEAVSRIAGVEILTPAVITRAASVVQLIKDTLGPQASAAAVERLINATLMAQGHGGVVRPVVGGLLPAVYDPAFINADCDLDEVATGLVAARSGRLCLYGPPGTGKTAFGRWLSERMEAPLLVRRASDLLSMWVGENEKNIARAFTEAQESGAILLIDEVDSFLRDRRGAERNWEVTLVNEMLTRMETFDGVFIASTNLMAGLDQASLRRFDLKVRFDYLGDDQAQRLFRRYCDVLGVEAGTEELIRLARLANLTPGDFAAVIRQSRFRPIRSAVLLVAALERECSVKEGANRWPVGFVR